MENSICISANVPETLRNYNVVTVRDVAVALGVSTDTVKNCIRRIMPNKMQNGKTTLLNEQEFACISKELKSNAKVTEQLTYEAALQVKNTTTELEIIANARSAFLALDELYKQKETEYKATIENQNKQIEALTPDAESWRKFAESDGTFSATNVAKLLKISRDELLDFLKIKHYIMRERSDNPNKKGRWQATALGIERGYVVNYLYTNDKISHVQFHITPKGMQKIEQVFCHNELTPEEQKRLEKICKEAEKNMRPSVIGLAE